MPLPLPAPHLPRALIRQDGRGEVTAAALENRLDEVEARIDQLLASMEQDASQQVGNEPGRKNPSNDSTEARQTGKF